MRSQPSFALSVNKHGRKTFFSAFSFPTVYAVVECGAALLLSYIREKQNQFLQQVRSFSRSLCCCFHPSRWGRWCGVGGREKNRNNNNTRVGIFFFFFSPLLTPLRMRLARVWRGEYPPTLMFSLFISLGVVYKMENGSESVCTENVYLRIFSSDGLLLLSLSHCVIRGWNISKIVISLSFRQKSEICHRLASSSGLVELLSYSLELQLSFNVTCWQV